MDEIQQYITKYASERGVDPNLIRAIISQESGGSAGARSPKGARGLMQLMPRTAAELGVDPDDPEDNIKGGVKYIADLLDHFNGDSKLALAAYHAGQTAVDRAGGIPDTNDGITSTQGYVDSVMGRYERLRNGEPEPEYTPKTKSQPVLGPNANMREVMKKVMDKKDRIAALPPEARSAVIDRLFDRVMTPLVPKAFDDNQRALLKKNFTHILSGENPEALSTAPTEADYKRTGFNTGPGGRFGAGFDRGLANIASVLEKIAGPPDKYAQEAGFGTSAGLHEKANTEMAATQPYAERHPVKAAIAGTAGQATPAIPFGAAVTEGLPAAAAGDALLTKLGINATKGAVSGGVENMAFDPTAKGALVGAGAGAATSIPLTLLGKLRNMIPRRAVPTTASVTRAAAPAIAPASTAAPGVTENALQGLERVAQAKFGKAIKDLTSDQKIEAVNLWKAEATKAANETRTAAATAAKNRTVDKAKAAAEAKISNTLKRQQLMEEAKRVSKAISVFRRENKRIPTVDEIEALKVKVREEMLNPTAAPVTAPPAAKAAAATATPVTKVPVHQPVERPRSVVEITPDRPKPPTGTTERRVKDLAWTRDPNNPYSIRMSFLRSELTKETDPAKIAEINQAIESERVKAVEYGQRNSPDKFKAESPEAIKAVQAVTEVAKPLTAPPEGGPVVQKIAPGVSGLTPAQQEIGAKLDDALAKLAEATDPKVRASIQKTVDNLKAGLAGDEASMKKVADAERKAASRAAAAAQNVNVGETSGGAGQTGAENLRSSSMTPEEIVTQAEEQFYELTDRLETFGQLGKRTAQELNKMWKKPPKGMSRQQLLEAGEKAIEHLRSGTKPGE